MPRTSQRRADWPDKTAEARRAAFAERVRTVPIHLRPDDEARIAAIRSALGLGSVAAAVRYALAQTAAGLNDPSP